MLRVVASAVIDKRGRTGIGRRFAIRNLSVGALQHARSGRVADAHRGSEFVVESTSKVALTYQESACFARFLRLF
jgi:hypothetical protein